MLYQLRSITYKTNKFRERLQFINSNFTPLMKPALFPKFPSLLKLKPVEHDV